MASGIPAGAKRRIVILGGGFGGAYAAQELAKRLNPSEFEITVLDRNNYLLFYPLLVEAGVGAIEPRHVVVPIRKFMPRTDFRMAEILGIDTQAKQVRFKIVGSDAAEQIHYDHLVFALGSVTRIPDNVPGLKQFGFELKSLGDAVQLRDRAIRLLELANSVADEKQRRALLRVVVIGANFTGVELAGEYQAFMREASKNYPNVNADDIDVMLLEFGDRILPAVRPELAEWAYNTLTNRGLDIRTGNTVTEIGLDFAVLKSGERIPTHTVVWAAGIAPSPLIPKVPTLPMNQKGYIECERDLRVKGFQDIWAIGDSATVYDERGKAYAATAQNASRQGPHVARNIASHLKGEPTQPFDFDVLGSFAAIGHRSAAAEFLGWNFKGFLGWFLYRGTYLMKMPTLAMKLRLSMDWALELVLPTEPVQLGVHRPSDRTLGEAPPQPTEIAGNPFKLLR